MSTVLWVMQNLKKWMTNYSNVYCGFTGAVENFGTAQIVGRQSIPMNRILLETDTPYMRPGGKYNVSICRILVWMFSDRIRVDY